MAPRAGAQRDPVADDADTTDTANTTGARARGEVDVSPERAAEVPPPAPPRTTARERSRRLTFHSGTRPVGAGDLATTGALVGALLGLRAIDRPERPSWDRVNRFDAAARGGLRLGANGRDAIATASDALLFTLAAYPLVVEDLALVLISDRNPALAARLTAIDAQSFAVMGLLVGAAKLGAARERPYAHAAGCEQSPNAPGCDEDDRNMSFFSGHAAMAFTGAGLACFHQQQIEGLYGSRGAGLAVCGSAMALATTTSLFRVMADKHWATDVLAGAGIGLFAGWLLPWLTHGRSVLDFEGERVRGSVGPTIGAGAFGLEINGTF